MSTDPIFILGAGGHARVVIDALLSQGVLATNVCVRDDNPLLAGKSLLGCRIEAPMSTLAPITGLVHAAVGDAAVRAALLAVSGRAVSSWLTIVHTRAIVSFRATVGAGSFIAAQAVVGPEAQLGVGTIVNHGAVVDHECVLGDYCHVAPLASLGGGVRLGDRVLIGAGARVLPGVMIGSDAIIGAGAVVLHNVPAGQTWVGVPAYQSNKG